MRSEERKADRIAEKLYNNDLYCYRAVGRDKALRRRTPPGRKVRTISRKC